MTKGAVDFSETESSKAYSAHVAQAISKTEKAQLKHCKSTNRLPGASPRKRLQCKTLSQIGDE
jgi:hypothetical protein